MSNETLGEGLARGVLTNGPSVLSSGMLGRGRRLALRSVVSTVTGRSMLDLTALRRVTSRLNGRLTNVVGVFGPRVLIVNKRVSIANSCLALPIGVKVGGCSLGIVGRSSRVIASRLGSRTNIVKTYLVTQRGLLAVWGLSQLTTSTSS